MDSGLLTEVGDATVCVTHEGRRVRLRDPEERRWVAVLVAVDLVVLAAMWHAWFRPLWHDEVWRAYHVTLTSGFFSSLHTANAPMGAGWLALERMSTASFGNVEWALRLPSFVSLFVFSIATYRLARWWLPPAWASSTALCATLNGSLLLYGLQLRPYLVDAACTSLLLGAWLTARDRRASGASARGEYTVIAACALISLPAVLMIGPLVAYDALGAFRKNNGGWRGLAGPLTVGVIAGAHLVLFVMPQSFLAHNPYWRAVALAGSSSTNLRHLRTAIVSFPAGVATAVFTSPKPDFQHSALQRAPALPLHAAIAFGCVVVWAVGAFAIARRHGGPVLLVALVGSFAAAVVAATRNEWPVGFVRANLFAVPMLYVLGAVGLYAIVQSAIRNGWNATSLLLVASLAGAAVAGTGLWRLTQIHDATQRRLSLDEMRALVAEERETAVPGDLFVVLTDEPDPGQWLKAHLYYATLSDRTRLAFPSGKRDELGLAGPSTDKTAAFIAGHPPPHHVFLVDYYAARDGEVDSELQALRRSGFCPEATTQYGSETGSMTVLRPCVR